MSPNLGQVWFMDPWANLSGIAVYRAKEVTHKWLIYSDPPRWSIKPIRTGRILTILCDRDKQLYHFHNAKLITKKPRYQSLFLGRIHLTVSTLWKVYLKRKCQQVLPYYNKSVILQIKSMSTKVPSLWSLEDWLVFLIYMTKVSNQIYTHHIDWLWTGVLSTLLFVFCVYLFCREGDWIQNLKIGKHSSSELQLPFNSVSPKNISIRNHTNNLCDKFLKSITLQLKWFLTQSFLRVWTYGMILIMYVKRISKYITW